MRTLASSAHDKRRHKRIDRLLTANKKRLEKACKKAVCSPFFCEPDARAAAEKLVADATGSYHDIRWKIDEVEKLPRGRPPKDKPRKPIGREYHLRVDIVEDAHAVAPLRMKAGCFVLITNLSTPKFMNQWPAHELLRLYKASRQGAQSTEFKDSSFSAGFADGIGRILQQALDSPSLAQEIGKALEECSTQG